MWPLTLNFFFKLSLSLKLFPSSCHSPSMYLSLTLYFSLIFCLSISVKHRYGWVWTELQRYGLVCEELECCHHSWTVDQRSRQKLHKSFCDQSECNRLPFYIIFLLFYFSPLSLKFPHPFLPHLFKFIWFPHYFFSSFSSFLPFIDLLRSLRSFNVHLITQTKHKSHRGKKEEIDI